MKEDAGHSYPQNPVGTMALDTGQCWRLFPSPLNTVINLCARGKENKPSFKKFEWIKLENLHSKLLDPLTSQYLSWLCGGVLDLTSANSPQKL